MKMVEIPIPEDKHNIKCPYTMVPQFIVVHNTANDAAAENEIKYRQSTDDEVACHYAVDDKEAVLGIPLNRNAWHAGDGRTGRGNRCGIAVEICYSKSGGIRFEKAEENAAQLIAEMLTERGWGIDRVTKHQDYSGKYCPHRTIDMGWDRFLNMVRAKMAESKDYAALVCEKCGLESQTRAYLDKYKYAPDLWRKLWAAMA
ncbi:MAG: N-acetylmuramoyl-L-alanine amidase [Clostridia bacterium]|nr:N-acetylmuramoyl-L-alanine amidase [Clostridia bacterium]